MPDNDDLSEIQKLLRLKRYETPGPEYFDQFVTNFQHRQRCDMLRVPAWKIAVERAQVFFSEFQVPRMAYAGAFAAVAISVLGAVSQLQPGSASATAAPVAKNSSNSNSAGPTLALAPNSPSFQLPAASFQPASFPATRYVLETRPVSYGTQNSF